MMILLSGFKASISEVVVLSEGVAGFSELVEEAIDGEVGLGVRCYCEESTYARRLCLHSSGGQRKCQK